MKRKREEGPDERFVEITTKGEKILPDAGKKYCGSIYKRDSNWRLVIKKVAGDCSSTTHKTYEDAESYMIKYNIRKNLPIKNIIYKYKDEYYCILTRYQLMKFSIEDRPLVEKYVWRALHALNNYKASTTVDDKKAFFHDLLFPEKSNDQKIEHSNGLTLDNTRVNVHLRQQQKRTKPGPDKKFIEVVSNGEKIFPTMFEKYIGSICQYNNQWKSMSNRKYKHIKRELHDSIASAQAHIIEVNKEENLPIKNMVYTYKGEYYCMLTQNQMMKFSVEDLDLVQNRIWFAHYDKSVDGYYSATNIDGKYKAFTHLMFDEIKKGESCDHISRETLDNRRENVRIASASTQSINKGLMITNSSGKCGVSYSKYNNSWVAQWQLDDGKKKSKSFSIDKYKNDVAFQMACTARQDATRKIEKYQIALNLQV